MSKAEELAEKYKGLKEEHTRQGEALLKEFFTELFNETEDLNLIKIVGYTPGFNDGDPCVHSQYVDTDDTIEDMEDYLSEEWIEKYKDKENNVTIEIGRMVDQFEDILYGIYDTDWMLIITRDDSEEEGIKIKRYDYDCGY